MLKEKSKGKKGNIRPDASQMYLEELEQKEVEHRQLKKDMSNIIVSSQDKNDLGMLSSGWKAFEGEIKSQLQKARIAGATKANDVAKFWNETGFKTASGNRWTPRLVNIIKDREGIRHGSKIISK